MVQLGGKTLMLPEIAGLYNPTLPGDPVRRGFRRTQEILQKHGDILEELNRRNYSNIRELSQSWDLLIEVVSNRSAGGYYNGRIQQLDETNWDTNNDSWINHPDHPVNVIVQNVEEQGAAGHLLSAGELILATKFTSDEKQQHNVGIPEPDTGFVGPACPTSERIVTQVYGVNPGSDETFLGSFHIIKVDANTYGYFNFRLPANYDAVTKVEVIYIPSASSTETWTLEGHAYDDGDTYSATPMFSIAKASISDTINVVNVIDFIHADITADFAAGKWVGMRVTNTETLGQYKAVIALSVEFDIN